jgi:hypothetical protein
MAYRKSIRGDQNEQNEQLSNNRISRVIIEGGGSLLILTVFSVLLVTTSIIFMAFVHLALLESLIVASFVGFFLCLWIVALAFTIRQVSAAKTAVAVDTVTRNHAATEAAVIYASEQYILYRDPDGTYQFRGTVHVDEHRQFLPIQVNPPSQQEAILTCWDSGMSGRSIEKWLSKDGKKVSYREIAKTLDLYRPGWNTKAVVNSDPPAEE